MWHLELALEAVTVLVEREVVHRCALIQLPLPRADLLKRQ